LFSFVLIVLMFSGGLEPLLMRVCEAIRQQNQGDTTTKSG
jgi:hypothetical protein